MSTERERRYFESHEDCETREGPEALLFEIVDVVFGYANEDESVPSTAVAAKLIAKAKTRLTERLGERPTRPALTREEVARIIRQNCRASEVGNDEVTGSYAAADAILSLLPAEAERAAAENVSAAIERAREEENEACAKIVAGEIYRQSYRTWPAIPGFTGNRSSDSEVVRHCDALAAAIRSRRGSKT